MSRQVGKPIAGQKVELPDERLRTSQLAEESHQMTLARPLGVSQEVVERASHSTIEYHLTATVTNNSLSRRELSLLLEVLNFQVVYFGANFAMMLAMYELYFRLLGNKRSAEEVSEGRIRLTLTVSELILKTLKHEGFSLDSSELRQLPIKVIELLKPHLMSKRTYGSRFRTWRPERLIVIKAVPVDIRFLSNAGTRPGRYSGYTKGYGESHPSAHKQRTKPSSELDGNGSWPENEEEKFLFRRCTEPLHVLCEFLLIKYNAEIQEEPS